VSSACLISHVPSYPFLPADSVAGRFWNWRTFPALYSARGVEHPAEQVLDQVALFAVVLRSGSSANGSVISLPLLGGRCPRVARTSGEREPSHCQTEKCSHPGRVEAARSPSPIPLRTGIEPQTPASFGASGRENRERQTACCHHPVRQFWYLPENRCAVFAGRKSPSNGKS
jgi:hypothetical protein